MRKMSEGGLWACSDCSHTSSQAAGMRNHVESHHVGGTGYVCGVCNRFCRTKNALDTHRSRYKHFWLLIVPTIAWCWIILNRKAIYEAIWSLWWCDANLYRSLHHLASRLERIAGRRYTARNMRCELVGEIDVLTLPHCLHPSDQ